MSELSRPCISCGKMHDTGVQNSSTGEMLSRCDKCYDCIMHNGYSLYEITDKVSINDKTIQKEWDALRSDHKD